MADTPNRRRYEYDSEDSDMDTRARTSTEKQAARYWRVLIPQAPTHPATDLTTCEFQTGQVSTWYTQDFIKASLANQHLELMSRAKDVMSAWAQTDKSLNQFFGCLPFWNQQFAKKWQESQLRTEDFRSDAQSLKGFISLYSTLPADDHGDQYKESHQQRQQVSDFAIMNNSKRKELKSDLPMVGRIESLLDVQASLWWFSALVMAMSASIQDHLPVLVIMLQKMAGVLNSVEIIKKFPPRDPQFRKQLHLILALCQKVVSAWCDKKTDSMAKAYLASDTTPAYIFLDATAMEAHFRANLLALADKDVTEVLQPITMPSQNPSKAKKQRAETSTTTASASAPTLPPEDVKACKAVGFLNVTNRAAHRANWANLLKAFPSGICLQHAIQKSYCRHGMSGDKPGMNRGKLFDKCKYKHTNWNQLNAEEQATVKAFCDEHSDIYKLDTN